MNAKNHVTILTSGGIDSTACINFYSKLGFQINALFIDYQQKALTKELAAVQSITGYYKIPLEILRIAHNNKWGLGEVNGRNGAFLLIALMQSQHSNGLICIGIHKGTTYYDCSSSFIQSMQDIFNGYTKGSIQVSVPFLNFNKSEIYTYCLEERVPFHLTYSCEIGEAQPCGICLTCKDLQKICIVEAKR